MSFDTADWPPVSEPFALLTLWPLGPLAVRTCSTVFKDAPCAPRAWRRVTGLNAAGELAHSRRRTRSARGEPAAPSGGRSPFSAAHVGGRRGMDPGNPRHRPGAAHPLRARTEHPPSAAIVEAAASSPSRPSSTQDNRSVKETSARTREDDRDFLDSRGAIERMTRSRRCRSQVAVRSR
jgi:hypothetical protein